VEPGEEDLDSGWREPRQRRSTARRQESPSEMIETWAGTVNQEIRHQADIRPYTTVLAAAAVGYVLGAGVPRWVYRTAWDVGSKALLARLVSRLVDPE
jgi:hypothetical protein